MSTDENARAVRRLLTELGLSLEDLQQTDQPTPTIAEYLPRVIEASGNGARHTYGSYWTRIVATLGERRLDEVTATDIEALIQQTISDRVRRRSDRGGSSTREHLLRAMRAIYSRAEADNLISNGRNPAARVPKPQRPETTRRALSPDELAAINAAVASSGNDTALDCLLIRLHIETACRRGGAIALREIDLDPEWDLIRLEEKRDAVRWQPVSPSLMQALLQHRAERGSGQPTTRQLLRYQDGTPLTTRRYDNLWKRVGTRLPWVAAQGISTHWLRHTTLTWVERRYGYGVARAYGGHLDGRGPATTTYIRATLHEIAIALAALSGEDHPCANAPSPGTLPPHWPWTTSGTHRP
jgi:integrase